MTVEGDRPNPLDAQPIKQKSLEEGLHEVRDLLGNLAGEILTEDREITELSKEHFQSNTFQIAGYSYMPDRYGNADRFLYTVKFADGSQSFIINGKISSDNPYEVGHAANEGIDLRKSHTIVYQYDGQKTIIERSLDGDTKQYSGEYGKPEALIPHLKQSMGESVQVERFIKPQ